MLFTPTAGVPDFSRDDPVLFFDDGTRGGIAIEAPEDVARHSAIGTQRAVFVNHVEKREFNARCRLACHFVFLSLFNAATHRARHRDHRAATGKTKIARHVAWMGKSMARTAKLKRVRIYSRGAPNQPATQGGSLWHSSRITVETGPSDRGQHVHAPRKNKEKRRRRLRCAKPSARQPKPRRMRSKRPGSLEG